jgi:diacylglycerol kinase (ATP)
MEASQAFTFNGRIRSVKPAIDGIWLVLRSQHNARVHLFASIAVIISGIRFQISPSQWALIITAIVLVWISEALNTAFEFLCDVASPNFHPLVKKAKDVSAAAVLISAVGATAIGCIVFVPYLIQVAGH